MFKKTKLKNGLTLITAPLKQTKAVTVLVLLPVGSRHETKEINGVSHFVEHLLFKGTQKRPTSLDITKELDSIGAEFNAFTSKDHTGYYIKASADKIELAFDILSDMIFNSTFNKLEIAKERGVIIEEINMYDDNPLLSMHHLLEETVFGDHPLGWWVSGPKKTIKNISRSQILNYKNKFYQPSSMVVAVSGNVKNAQVKKMADKYFGFSSNKKANKDFVKININQTAPRVKLMNKKTEQVQIGFGFPAFSGSDPRIYSLYLLSVILGGNMSSRLFTSVREEHGLAYQIRTDQSNYQDTGVFIVQAGLDKKRLDQAIKLILTELKKVKEFGVTDKELRSAKDFIKGKLTIELEDSENIADWYGKQELLLDQIYTPEQRLKKFFAVSKDQIKKTAEEIFKNEKINLTVIGPFDDKNHFQKLLKF
ncbi:insulinase family protein [Candidatus Falkowbacteria bacterium]|nr:insulinase family protein [Candidatus Falkowbacteria bacterium]